MNDGQQRRMLIVDDDEGMRRSLTRIMVTKGFNVCVARDGMQAIEVAKEFQPEILLMDVRMPGIDGVEAYRRMKDVCPDAAVIFMTAFSATELSQQAIAEGAIDVLPKPLNVDSLCDLISASRRIRPLLIVDDDSGFRTSLRRALTVLGYKVYTAGSMADAVTEFRRNPRCLVILDMKLDGHTGLQVLQQIRNMNGNVTAILMTGHPDLQVEMQSGLQDGACCTFLKPFDVDALASEIQSQLC